MQNLGRISNEVESTVVEVGPHRAHTEIAGTTNLKNVAEPQSTEPHIKPGVLMFWKNHVMTGCKTRAPVDVDISRVRESRSPRIGCHQYELLLQQLLHPQPG